MPRSSQKPKGSVLHELADEDLVALTQRGELAAFDLLYERHKRSAYALARRIVGPEGGPDDVVQETFISVWRSIERFDPNRASVRTWLLRIVHRRAIDALRSRMVHSRRRAEGEGIAEDLESGEAGPDALAVMNEEAENLRSALGELPEDQRSVIELAYYQGFTHSEIAELIQAPLGTVKGRMRLGLEKMRTTLEDGASAQGGRTA